jgi:heat shock protein beta
LADESYEFEEEEEEEESNEIDQEVIQDDGEEEEATQEEEENLEEDKYDLFWTNFGKTIKLGVIEDSGNRMKLAKLLRFYSTNDKDELTSLDEYISRMKDD